MKYILPFLALVLVGCSAPTVDFEWEFEPGKTYSYAYSQFTENSVSGLSENESTAELNMKMLIEGESDSTAMVLMKEATIETNDGNVQELPELPGEKITKKGKFDQDVSNVLFTLLMALPSNDIKLGETEEIPFDVPFYTAVNVHTSVGTNKLTFDDVVDYEGHQCALLTGEITYSDPEFSPEEKGLANNGTGSATYYFDINRQIFLKNEIEIEMNASYDEQTHMQIKTSIELIFEGE